MMHNSFLLAASALLLSGSLSAQWVQGGIFATVNHFQASVFQGPDTGLFVYGGNNPGNDEGGIIATYDGNVGGGYYLWYRSGMILEDIDMQWDGSDPRYMAAGSQQYNYSVIVRPTPGSNNPFQFDSVRTHANQYYRAIRIRTDLVAFAGGGDSQGNGIIDKSTDGGTTWTNNVMFPGQPVSRLHFVNDQLGFASTGGYRRTNNNGVLFPDSGAIYRTPNGGLWWEQVLADANEGFSDVAFSSALIGAATRNDGVVLHTTDGGDTWSTAFVDLVGPLVMTSVTFRPDGTGFASAYRPDGTSGFILISTDGGANWYENFSTASLNHSRRIYDVGFRGNGQGVASTHIRPLKTNGLITEVMEQEVATSFSLQPNPTTDIVVLLLEDNGPGSVELLDALGRVIWSANTNGVQRFELPTEGLVAGTYHVRCSTNQGQRSQVLLKL